MSGPVRKFQLWVYYETKAEWKMEGFFDNNGDAMRKYSAMYNDSETPCISDVYTVEVGACL